MWAGGGQGTELHTKWTQVKLSGCPVSMCRDRGRGGEQEMDDVRKRENVWFIVFTS